MAHGRGGRTPRRDTPRVSAIGLARTPTLRKAVAFEQRRGSKPPLRGDRGSGGGARGSLRSSVGPARAHTLVHLLPLVASSGMRKQTYLYGLGINCEHSRDEEEQVGRRSTSGRQDKDEGARDRAKGQMKEAAGALTGDKDTKAKCRADQRRGKFKEKKGNLKDLLK